MDGCWMGDGWVMDGWMGGWVRKGMMEGRKEDRKWTVE